MEFVDSPWRENKRELGSDSVVRGSQLVQPALSGNQKSSALEPDPKSRGPMEPNLPIVTVGVVELPPCNMEGNLEGVRVE